MRILINELTMYFKGLSVTIEGETFDGKWIIKIC